MWFYKRYTHQKKWVQPVLGPFWGKAAWTCRKFSHVQSPSLVLSHGCLSLPHSSVLNPEFWTVLRLWSPTQHSSYCSDLLSLHALSSGIILSTLYRPSSSFSLWDPEICLSFVFFCGWYVLPQTHAACSGLIYSLFSVTCNLARLKQDQCKFYNFTDQKC